MNANGRKLFGSVGRLSFLTAGEGRREKGEGENLSILLPSPFSFLLFPAV
jgi:hypothetical protein